MSDREGKDTVTTNREESQNLEVKKRKTEWIGMSPDRQKF